MSKKWIKRIGCGLVVSGALVACDEWTFWDDMFKRTAIGATNRGWTGGDGAFSAALPNNREFWIFGDSLVTNWTSQQTRDGADLIANMVVGNTIAIQNDRANPSASGIDFFARAPGMGSATTAVVKITSVPNNTDLYKQFFNHERLGLAATETRFLWPVASECLHCNDATNARLLVSFFEWERCEPAGSIGCDPVVKNIRRTGNIIARFKDLARAPDANPGWTRDGDSLYIPRSTDQIQWGVAFLKDTDNKVYIYAQQPVVNRLFVAKAVEATVLSGGWPAWRTASGVGVWSSDGALPIRPVAEQVPKSGISIDLVTRDNKPSYVLVHSNALVNNHVYVRTTPTNSVNGPTTAATWSAPGPTTPRIDIATIDSSLSSYSQSLIDSNKCDPIFTGSSLAPEYKLKCPPEGCPVPRWACGWGYHGIAHHEMATSDGAGLAGIPVSYIVPSGVNGTQNTAYYRPKFTALDLKTLSPWCSPSTTSCWEGIVKEWPRRTVGSSGVASYLIDLQAATKIWANVARLAGSPTLEIEFYNGSSSLGFTNNCPVSGTNVTCNVSKPTGATWAIVRVVGASTNQFILRVHHAGNY
jgi:hypothetical protein